MKVPAELASILGLSAESFEFIQKSQNEVYAFNDTSGNRRILRLTLASHRTWEELEDEIELLLHLQVSSLSVCSPVSFPDGSWIVASSNGPEVCYGVIFEHTCGHALTRADLGNELYFLHGFHLGSLHSITRPDGSAWLSRRKKWSDERYFTSDIDNFLPDEYRLPIRGVFRDLQKQLSRLITDTETGTVHLDLGYSNFHRNGETLELFDFDNCSYGPLVLDVSAALYGGIFTPLWG